VLLLLSLLDDSWPPNDALRAIPYGLLPLPNTFLDAPDETYLREVGLAVR
jgi:hypothetical protein